MDGTQKAEFTAVVNRLAHLNEITSRFLLAQKLSSGQARDIDKECHYPTDVSVEDYYKMYKRGDVARRVVTVYPDYCWKESPEIYEIEDNIYTEFETAWNAIAADQSLNVFANLLNVDRLSGIGQFGVLFLGFDGGSDFRTPVTKATALRYLRAFDQRNVTITETEKDTNSPRYALPVMYKIKMVTATGGTDQRDVHWTRVLHVADDAVESPVFGTPRLEAVYNRFLDIKQILGGSAEMFWKGGFPGTIFKLDPEAQPTDDSLAEMKEQIHRYEESLSRILRLQGVEAQQLSVQVASPAEHLDSQFKAISATTGIPMRVLFGSEQAQLASIQDRKNWYDRIQARRKSHCIPNILHPFVQRLIDVGVLPRPNFPFKVVWLGDNMLDVKEQADVARVRTETLARYADSPMSGAVMPTEQFLVRIMGFTMAEAEAIIKDIQMLVKDDVSVESVEPNERSKKGY